MSRLDATAGAYVTENRVIRPVNFVYLDFDGDPVRANDSGRTITVSGMSQPDLNGEYLGVTPDVGELSPIRVAEGGSSSVTVKLSGNIALDAEALNIIGDEAKWKGRTARVWRAIFNAERAQQGQFQHYYTGYMVDCMIGGGPDEQWIELTIESYLAAFSQASNRTYQSQQEYDPGDTSGLTTQPAGLGGGNSIPGLIPDRGTSVIGSGAGVHDTLNPFEPRW